MHERDEYMTEQEKEILEEEMTEEVQEETAEAAEEVLVLYGGSVKPENIKAYLTSKDIDGALVGGASLKIDSYQAMVENLVK